MNGNEKITIRTEAARQDAAQLTSIINTIQTELENLEVAIKKNIPEEIETDWATELRREWEAHYNREIPEAIEQMKLSAANLETVIANAETFSQQS